MDDAKISHFTVYTGCLTEKLFFLFVNQNIIYVVGIQKNHLSETDDAFEHPKHMLKIMGKQKFTILVVIQPYILVSKLKKIKTNFLLVLVT